MLLCEPISTGNNSEIVVSIEDLHLKCFRMLSFLYGAVILFVLIVVLLVILIYKRTKRRCENEDDLYPGNNIKRKKRGREKVQLLWSRRLSFGDTRNDDVTIIFKSGERRNAPNITRLPAFPTSDHLKENNCLTSLPSRAGVVSDLDDFEFMNNNGEINRTPSRQTSARGSSPPESRAFLPNKLIKNVKTNQVVSKDTLVLHNDFNATNSNVLYGSDAESNQSKKERIPKVYPKPTACFVSSKDTDVNNDTKTKIRGFSTLDSTEVPRVACSPYIESLRKNFEFCENTSTLPSHNRHLKPKHGNKPISRSHSDVEIIFNSKETHIKIDGERVQTNILSKNN